MNKILWLLVIMNWASCYHSKDTLKDKICISFDVRQCQGDPWADQIDLNTDVNSQIHQYARYFESVDLQTAEININLDYHQIVCEACFVCPQGPRIFLKIDSSDFPIIQSLTPLNLERLDCSVF